MDIQISARKVAAGWQNYQEQELSRRALNLRFSFRTPGMKALWTDFILSQISDGMWENANTGWRFWSDMPTATGGATKLSGGGIPSGVRRQFPLLSLLDAYTEAGQDMLGIVQQHEPAATLATVAQYLKEIQRAMVGAPTEEAPTQTAPGKLVPLPDEAGQRTLHAKLLKAAVNHLNRANWALPDWEAFLYAKSGGRAGKFHYFAVFRSSSVSVYGVVGGQPKAVSLGQSDSVLDGIDLCKHKIREKLSKGYEPVHLAGMRLHQLGWSPDLTV